MMKRVCNTRFAMSAMLLAVFLLVTGAGAPVWARENISAGQAGDPGDGLDVASGGSNGTTAGDGGDSANSTVRPAQPVPNNRSVLLIPYFDGSNLRFIMLFEVNRLLEYLK
jgi:hypothetical protein